MARLYLVRHGKASSSWDADLDPGLDAVGREQAEAIAARFGSLRPLALITSPMRRTRETAAPLEGRWHRVARIERAVAEIPSPTHDLAARGAWLRAAMAGTWSDLDPALAAWRAGVGQGLGRIDEDAVIFTHFIAINAAVGLATRDERLVCFHPDNGSVTILETDGDDLRVVELGAQAATEVR